MTANYVAGDFFDRGKTYYGGATPEASTDYGGVFLEGQVRIFPNRNPSSKQTRRGGQSVVCICVRNVSSPALSLPPKRLAGWATGYRGLRVDGYSYGTTVGEAAGVVDEFLPSAGVTTGDLFWLVVEGPTLVKTSANSNNATTSEGTVLVTATAATSQSTLAGRAAPIDTSGATGTLAAMIYNRIGRAMSANTSQGTDRDILVEVKLL